MQKIYKTSKWKNYNTYDKKVHQNLKPQDEQTKRHKLTVTRGRGLGDSDNGTGGGDHSVVCTDVAL